MSNVIKLGCILCGEEYQEEETLTCRRCGSEGILDVVYDYEKVAHDLTRERLSSCREMNHWRYRALMPVDDNDAVPPLRVGWSPLYNCERLAKETGLRRVYIKDDGQNPTNSLKDRASSVGVARALKANSRALTCASTGNAATSLAGNAASAGLTSYIFVPERIPQAKLAQLLIFGAVVFVVQGTYEDAFALSMKASEEFGWYNRNSAINPYLIEGKKTVAFEICEQMDWQAPEWISMSVGDGCSIAALWKGMKEFHRLGLIDRLPRLLAVQAEGASPIYKSWKGNREKLDAIKPETIADSIAVGTPRNWRKALRAVTESNGVFVTVSDTLILSAMRLLGTQCGIFAEPAASAAVAAIKVARQQNFLRADNSILAVITGNGLKDTSAAIKASQGLAHVIPPAFEEVSKRVSVRD